MKKKLFLFSLLAVFLAWFWFGGISMADTEYVATTWDSCGWETLQWCYETLQAAVAAAQSGDTVTLLDNITLNSSVNVNKSITLDLWWKTLTMWNNNNNRLYADWSSVEATITNWTVNTYNSVYASNWATLNLKDSLTINAQEMAITSFTWGTVNINWWTYTANDNCVIWTNWSSWRGDNTITINWWTFNGNISTNGYIACGIYVANDDTVTVNWWTFNIKDWVWIASRWGTTVLWKDVTFNFTYTENGSISFWTLGKVWDSNVTIPAWYELVMDVKANYPWADSKFVTTNNLTWTYLNASSPYVVTIKDGENVVPLTLTKDGDSTSAKISQPDDPTKEWYIFDGWFKWEDNTAFDFDTVIADDTELKAHWSTAYTITLNEVSNWTISTDKEVAKEWDTVTLTATPNSNYNFTSWTVKNGDADVTVTNNTFTMPAGNVTVSATFTKKSSWGGGGSSSNSSNTTTNDWDDTPDDTADDPTQGDTTTINPELTDVESQEWYDNWWDQKEVLDNGLTRELNNAYEFAFRAGITTMKSAENANMEWTLNRIAMAKMLSQYAINVLGKKPDTSRTPNFWDVAYNLDKDYDNGVTLAYQLGIMGIWIDEFRPYDEVPRAEFVTALSRLLYGLADWTDNYYSTHMAKLQKEWIITNTDPNLLELRGYVMLMLMRSAK